MKPLSVILPVFNAAGTLESAVRSMQAQTFCDWELLLINDGSSDESLHLAETMAQRDPRILVVNQPHRGIVAALQAGLERSTGRFIARMDADDISHTERFGQQIDLLEKKPDIGLVGGQVLYGGDRNSHLGYALHVDWMNTILEPGDIFLNRFVESPFAHPSVMFRREVIACHGGYREGDFPEDYELWLRWMEAGVQMAKVVSPVLTWNDPPQRLSRQESRYNLDAFYAIKAHYLTRAIEKALHGREVWIWGAGRITRRRAVKLKDHGIHVAGYIDIDPHKWGTSRAGHQVISPRQIPNPEKAMVLGYVARRGARELIRAELASRGYVEGQDFWMAA